MKNRRIHKGHIFGASAFLAVPLAIFISKALAPLFVVTAVFALLADYLRERKLPQLPRPFVGLLALVVIWGLASALWSISPGNSIGLTPSLAGTFFGGLVLVSLAAGMRGKEQQFFEAGLLAGTGFGLVLLAIEIFTPLALTRVLVPLAKGYNITNYGKWIIENPHAAIYPNFYKTGAVILMLLAWPAFIVLWRRGLKTVTVIAFAALSFILISSQSGASVLGLGTGMFIFAAALFLQSRAGKIFSVLVVASIFAMPVFPRLLPTALEIERAFPYLPNSVYPRVFIWQSASNYIFEDPVLGKGLDSSRAISSKKDRVAYSENRRNTERVLSQRETEPIPLHPHNAVLQVLLELGVFGAIMLLAILLALIKRIDAIAGGRMVQAACFGMLFAAFTIANISFGIWQSWWQGTLWLAIAYMVGSLKTGERA